MGVILVRVSCNSIECASKLLHSRDVSEYPVLYDSKSIFHSGPSGFIPGTASDLASDGSMQRWRVRYHLLGHGSAWLPQHVHFCRVRWA